ncbi:MAG: ATP-binding cassette domain-containing protein [Bacilli bacterium]|nr:ATP-binding cassette domain-containing protein [Bacilli bacterium]
MKLTVKNYTKKIRDKIILDDINLDLRSGNVYGFYGRNGSGKTMLFRAISTLIFPNVGDVLVDDKSIINNDYDLSNFGLLIETPNFYPYLSGFDNLDILYRINNKKDDKHINEVLKKMDLYDDKDKKYKEYSLGMKQKLRIAQAIMENQQIIILDEPTNGLDEKAIKNLHNIILDLKSQNKIVLLASHNIEDLKFLCDKIFYISNGKLKDKKEDL